MASELERRKRPLYADFVAKVNKKHAKFGLDKDEAIEAVKIYHRDLASGK